MNGFAGSYKQNVCKSKGPSCIPCSERLPSCVGLSNGYHGFLMQWSSKYFQCYKNRTINVLNCKGYFDPNAKKCVEKIHSGILMFEQLNLF